MSTPTTPPGSRPARIQVTGLSRDEKEVILDAARAARKTVREWVLAHAQEDLAGRR